MSESESEADDGDAVSRCARLFPAKAGIQRGVAGNSPLERGAGDVAAPAWGKTFPYCRENLDAIR